MTKSQLLRLKKQWIAEGYNKAIKESYKLQPDGGADVFELLENEDELKFFIKQVESIIHGYKMFKGAKDELESGDYIRGGASIEAQAKEDLDQGYRQVLYGCNNICDRLSDVK